MAAKVNKKNAPTVFGEFKDMVYSPTKGGGEVKRGEDVVWWKWDKKNDMPRAGGKMVAIGEMCSAFGDKYWTAKQKADHATKVDAKKGTGTGSARKDKRGKKTEAAYWISYPAITLDAIASAIAKAREVVVARERAELARRTADGLTKLGMPLPTDLAALVTPAKADPAALVEAPKPELTALAEAPKVELAALVAPPEAEAASNPQK